MSILRKLIKLIEKLKKRVFIHIKRIYININYNNGGDYRSEIPYKII